MEAGCFQWCFYWALLPAEETMFMCQPVFCIVLPNPFCSESCILHSKNISFAYRLSQSHEMYVYIVTCR